MHTKGISYVDNCMILVTFYVTVIELLEFWMMYGWH